MGNRYGFKGIRKIYPDKVRSMCIRNDYYTCGTCEEYAEMFKMCECENPKMMDYELIAENILSHSDAARMETRTGMNRNELLKGIVFELVNDCTIVHIDAVTEEEFYKGANF